MKSLVSLLALLGLASIALADEHAAEGLDYGDHKSVTLQIKAWEALGAGKYDDAVAFTEKCAELYENEARKMQASLTSKPDEDVIHDYWALNDVGTCYFIRGEALVKLNKKDEALAVYKIVVSDFYYSQAWDPKGWYWRPSEAAALNIEMLRAQSDARPSAIPRGQTTDPVEPGTN